jgi:hypothetical protein
MRDLEFAAVYFANPKNSIAKLDYSNFFVFEA